MLPTPWRIEGHFLFATLFPVLFESIQHDSIPVGAVVEKFTHAADRRRTGAGPLRYLRIRVILAQQSRHFQAL